MAATNNDLAQVESKLAVRLQSGYTSLAATAWTEAEVKWPNVNFNTPQDGRWLRFSITSAGVIDQDASGSYELNRGFCTISVFFPRGGGSAAALTVAKNIKSLYTREIFDDLVIEQVSVSPSPEPDGSAFYGVNVTIQFSYQGYTS